MCDKAKGFFKGKFERLKELIVNNKVIVAILALFLIAFAVLIIVTATMPDANRLNYTEKADGTLEVAEIKNSYKDGWFCKDSLIVPEQVKGKKVTSVARLDSAKLQKIILPDSITEIKSKAFSDCSSLSEITLGNHLEIIGDGAWTRCTSLHEVRIPQSVRTVGINIFDDTPIKYNIYEGLNYVGNNENPYLVLIGAENTSITEVRMHENTEVAANSCFNGNGQVENADAANLANIPDKMFANCEKLKSVNISAATEIGANCFEECVRLTEVDLGEELTAIGYRAFSGCGKLKSVIIGSKVKEIADEAFLGCSGLKEVHVGDVAAWCKIGFGEHDANPLVFAHRLFVGEEEITKLKIPEGVTSIAKGAFMFCNGLTSVQIPDSVTVIEEYAFLGCGGLREVHIDDLAAWCKIKFGINDANPLGLMHRLFVGEEEITELKIPEGVTSVGDLAFRSCHNLISVDIPKSVTSIGGNTFEDCSALEYITVAGDNKNYSSRDGIIS